MSDQSPPPPPGPPDPSHGRPHPPEAQTPPSQPPHDQPQQVWQGGAWQPTGDAASTSRSGGARLGMIAAVVGPAIAVIAVISFAVGYFGQASRDDGGTITSAGSLSPQDMQVGDCYDDPENLEDGPVEINEVAAVPCDEPHDNEVFHTFDLTGDTLPSENELFAFVDQECVAAFETYTGQSYLDSDLDLFPLSPTDAGFDDGDRKVVCSLYALDLSKLEGSERAAG